MSETMVVEVEQRWREEEMVIREVTIPDRGNELERLDAAFHFGQNEFQPQRHRRSVSVGDVIRLGGKRFVVESIGFREYREVRR